MPDNTTKLLHKHFDLALDAPDGITRLRELILTLAMQGKLVPQDANDPPTTELLKQDESRTLSNVVSMMGIPPFDLPARWEWTTLGRHVSYRIGKTPPSKDPAYWASVDGPNWAAIGDLPKRGVLEKTTKKVTSKAVNEIFGYPPVPAGSLLMSFKLSIGKTAITQIDTYHNEAIISFTDLALETRDYLYWILESVTRLGDQKSVLMGNTLNSTSLNSLWLPLPPLPEQRRIVAKIDQLMAVCDDLEKKRDALVQKRLAVHNAAIRRLLKAGEASEFSSAWDFLVEHFGEVYSVKENVAELRKAILQLAVMGKLVKQDPNDESAQSLLERMAIERRNLLARGYPNPDESRSQLRKQASQMLPATLPALPRDWTWATLMQCSLLIVDCHNKTAPYVTSGIRLLRTTNIRNGIVNFDEPKFVSEGTYARWSARCEPEPGDILITREAPMGEVCIIPPDLKVCLGQRMMLARTVPGFIDNRYLLLTLRAPDMMDRVQDRPVGATVQHLRVGGVETMLVPVPPLPEQHRIVAKVDQLMALCDNLETQIDAATAQKTAILKAVLATV